MPEERALEKVWGCSHGCPWSQVSVESDLGSWALIGDNYVFLTPGQSLQARAVSWVLGPCSLLWEPGVRGHVSHSSPACGSACPLLPSSWGLLPMPPVLSLGLSRGRQGAGGGAGLPGQPLQVHEGATHAHREGTPPWLQAECVPGGQAGGWGGQGSHQEGHRAGTSALGDPDASPQALHIERVSPFRYWAGSRQGWISILTICWAASVQSPAHRPSQWPWFWACLTELWGRAAGCTILQRLTAALPSLFQLTCGRSTRQ